MVCEVLTICVQILGSTTVIRDALCARVDPIYGLTTMHASLLVFLAESQPASSSVEAKMGTYAFAVIALGKFILRLPDEILEEELPRLKATLISVRALVLFPTRS